MLFAQVVFSTYYYWSCRYYSGSRYDYYCSQRKPETLRVKARYCQNDAAVNWQCTD